MKFLSLVCVFYKMCPQHHCCHHCHQCPHHRCCSQVAIAIVVTQGSPSPLPSLARGSLSPSSSLTRSQVAVAIVITRGSPSPPPSLACHCHRRRSWVTITIAVARSQSPLSLLARS